VCVCVCSVAVSVTTTMIFPTTGKNYSFAPLKIIIILMNKPGAK
jgi:hypothetical protein